MDKRPIGIFDSGVGGLTVAKEIIKALPNESIIYLGDTARVPYGTRDDEIITKFALELTHYLLKKDIKFLVVACNTISATCLEEIEKISPVPVLGVIKPAVQSALKVTRKRKIGVIGTRATIRSGAYTREIRKLKPNIDVLIKACPLFVPLVEEGLLTHPISEMVAQEYLATEFDHQIDTLILGCTHYPLLREVIQKTVGKDVKLVDSARPTAEVLKQLLKESDLLSEGNKPKHQLLLTDTPPHVKEIIDLFFEGKPPAEVKKVYL